MSVRVDSVGFLRPPLFPERRSGKDRRRFLDPRFRNPAYPEFVDRRQADRRRPEYDEVKPLVQEHPYRKWIIVIGILAVFFLACLFLFLNFWAGERKALERGREGSMILSGPMPYDFPVGKKNLTGCSRFTSVRNK